LKEGFVDGDSESMAKIVDGLLKTSDKRISLAEAGHKAWRSRFTWENLTLDYEDLYNHLLERRAK
jgi:glycosyltransferase involved in cell wall biosynthesis